jgi:hypothetical protein
MPLIKPRTRGKQVLRHIARLERENLEALYAYADFLGESTDYVLNQVIDTVLARDKEFSKWRAEHPQSYVPAPVTRSRSGREKRAGRHVTPGIAPQPLTETTQGVS